MARVPPGATLSVEEARRVVRKPVRLRAAFEYWDERLKALNEPALDDLEKWNTRVGKAARKLDNGLLRVIFKNERPRIKARNKEQLRRNAQLLMDREGCLLSLTELAEELGSGTLTKLANDIAAFKRRAITGLGTPKTEASAARGLRAARELYDIVRRHHWAIRFEPAVSAAELLALFRQEGGLVITPPEPSFGHGPLILTTPKPKCRTSAVLISAANVERPGHDLVIPWEPQGRGIAIPDNAASHALEIFTTHLLVSGGLDSLTFVRPDLGHGLEELDHLVAAIPTDGPVEQALQRVVPRGLSTPQQQDVRWKIFPNMLMVAFDFARPEQGLPAVFDAAITTVRDLFASHAIIRHRRGRRVDIHLKGDDAGADTEVILRIQALWYLSRARVDTFVAHRDRAVFADLPPLTRFCNYLRFHLGDNIFVGNLLRTLVALPKLETAWKKQKDEFGPSLLAQLDATQWGKRSVAERKPILERVARDLAHWAQEVQTASPPAFVETRWRHVGLLDRIRGWRDAPDWIPSAPDAPQPPERIAATFQTLKRTADIARDTLALLRNEGLLDLVQRAYQLTPMNTLIQSKAVLLPSRRTAAERELAARDPLLKAHNFERLRRRYDDALSP